MTVKKKKFLPEIPFFDTANIRPEAARLIACFNAASVSAREARDTKVAVKNALTLFTATTGKTETPKLNDDEKNALRFSFLTLAARFQGDEHPGWVPYDEALGRRLKEIEQAAKPLMK